MAETDVAVAPEATIKSRPITASGLLRTALRNTLLDEDDSALSPSATDASDKVPARTSSSSDSWASDSDATWPRHGSSESATSTGISSICSSIAAADHVVSASDKLTPSRKRTADGTLKQPLPVSSSTIAPSKPPEPPLHDGNDGIPNEAKLQKRRGRPPRDKSQQAGSGSKVWRASHISKMQDQVRPRSSMPANLPRDVFANQCLEAAHASRLNPFALHPGENELLSNLLLNSEVTVYLNIRNAILRLWTQNPLCCVTPSEAAGCAKQGRFYGLAEVAYKWLVRNGYINFGCVEVPTHDKTLPRAVSASSKQKTVVIIGAGVSGLTAARQLEHLFAQSSETWTDAGEKPPRVIVLEGRSRIGGRVYSKPLRSQVAGSLSDDLRNTAEMGAMIVTGFEHGNPLDIIIRGQLGLRYHLMTDALDIYDCDGERIAEERDMLNTELYTDISDRAGDFRAEPQQQETLRGDEEYITRARDPIAEPCEHFQAEPLFDPVESSIHRKPALRRGRRRNAPTGTEKLTGRSRVVEESGATQTAARAVKTMGWQVKEGVARNQSISLHRIANASLYPTLGTVMDEAIEQYQDIVNLTPQDMRLLNWHHANLEYANAAPVSLLSLSGHDQDTGNEFEGAHSEIVGGYTQVPRGLMNLPTKLDVRFNRVVESIHYNETGDPEFEYSTKVVCEDGEVFTADEVVITAPLGVLKADAIDFDPPLPSWKQGAIDRMGFGLLNKVILLYDRPFWDDTRDMFGLLNDADEANSLNPLHYAERRGRFYLIWNATKISGRPMLVALMAGHAAYAAETTDTQTLLCEINERLRYVFKDAVVPPPLEVIVTRWKRDPFTRGTYSYVAPQTRPGDYDLMSEPIGNLHFAGEATCGTHPATVHGAFLSGLRVAAEVMESMAGPVQLPNPLVGPAPMKQETLIGYSTVTGPSQGAASGPASSSLALSGNGEEAIKLEEDPDAVITVASPQAKGGKPSGPPRQSVCASDASFWVTPSSNAADSTSEAAITAAILSQIGERPAKPTRPGVNPFLLYTKEKWDDAKATATVAGAGRDCIRQTLGRWWRALSDPEKLPYLAQSQMAQEQADAARKAWAEHVLRWDRDAKTIRAEYVQEHPPARPVPGRVEKTGE